MWISHPLHTQGLFRLQAIAGMINLFIFDKYLIVLAVVALLAEHSFWFSGHNMKAQFSYAVESFKSQQHNNITLVMAEVESAFTYASDKKDPAWLIQWVIHNKLVCNIIFTLSV